MKLRAGCVVTPIWWDTKANWEADAVTRVERDDDWRLTDAAFLDLWERWGPFDMDLMAPSVNCRRRPDGSCLPFFSRFFSPGCAGVDLLAQPLAPGIYYCFPHRRMVLPVVAYLSQRPGAKVVLVVRRADPGAWRPRLQSARVVERYAAPPGSVLRADLAPLSNVQFDFWVLMF